MGSRLHSLSGKKTRSISITSGKGGVGKTTITSNIAYHLGALGHKVLIFDGDVGMANVDIMFGARPRKSIYDVLTGECTLASVITQVAPNVSLIPGGSGVRELQNLNPFERRALLDEVGRLDRTYDYFLIDTAPGLSDNVLYLNMAAQQIMVVLTPDPASFADSYALIKVLNQVHKINRFNVISNQVESEAEGLSVYRRFNNVVQKFLDIGLDYWGAIPFDPNLQFAVQTQRLILRQSPQSLASVGIRSIVNEVEKQKKETEVRGGLEVFWEQLVGVA